MKCGLHPIVVAMAMKKLGIMTTCGNVHTVMVTATKGIELLVFYVAIAATTDVDLLLIPVNISSQCLKFLLNITTMNMLFAVSSAGSVVYNEVKVILIKKPNFINVYKTITTDLMSQGLLGLCRSM